MKWADVQCPDDDGETMERQDSGENFIARFLRVKPPLIAGLRSAKSVDDEIARRGVYEGEDNPEIVAEVIDGWVNRIFRRNRR